MVSMKWFKMNLIKSPSVIFRSKLSIILEISKIMTFIKHHGNKSFKRKSIRLIKPYVKGTPMTAIAEFKKGIICRLMIN